MQTKSAGGFSRTGHVVSLRPYAHLKLSGYRAFFGEDRAEKNGASRMFVSAQEKREEEYL
jgi:hypothetical protein